MYRKMRCKIPMNIQKFADPGTGDNGAGGTENAGGSGTTPPTPPAGQAPQFDYEKLANLIAGKQSVTEESVLKGYFKQQGLSKEQMDQAIAAFKQQQAANQPNIADMQSQITHGQEQVAAAQKAALQAQIESVATMAAVTLGIDAKTIPYVLKMADFSAVVGQDGKINNETLTSAINKVLEDVPALKPQTQQQNGFRFGAPGGGTPTGGQDDQLAAIFGNKK